MAYFEESCLVQGESCEPLMCPLSTRGRSIGQSGGLGRDLVEGELCICEDAFQGEFELLASSLYRCIEPFGSVLRSRCFAFFCCFKLLCVFAFVGFGQLVQLFFFSFFFSFTLFSCLCSISGNRLKVLTMHSSRERLRANGPASLLSWCDE